MALKDLFKRKEGGTLVGNLIRGAANKASGGILGNGVMKLKAGESTQQNTANLLTKVGAASETFNSFNLKGKPNATVEENITSGVQAQWLKKNWYIILLPVALVGFLIFRRKR